jgi:hypothetical protein
MDIFTSRPLERRRRGRSDERVVRVKTWLALILTDARDSAAVRMLPLSWSTGLPSEAVPALHQNSHHSSSDFDTISYVSP